MDYIVNPNRKLTHEGHAYSPGDRVELEKTVGNFHERVGTCHKFDPDIDLSDEALEQLTAPDEETNNDTD